MNAPVQPDLAGHAELPWHRGPLASYDCETTGTVVGTDRIVSAALIHPNGNVTRWLSDVDGVEIPEAATAVHGITTEHARAHGRPAKEVVEEITGWLAHEPSYDVGAGPTLQYTDPVPLPDELGPRTPSKGAAGSLGVADGAQVVDELARQGDLLHGPVGADPVGAQPIELGAQLLHEIGMAPGKVVALARVALEMVELRSLGSDDQLPWATHDGPELDLVCVEQQRPDHGVSEVAVGLLHEQEVSVLTLRAKHRQVVLGPSLPLDGRHMGVEGPGHAEVIEGEVAEGDVLLQFRRIRDPLAETLGQNHVVVGMGHQARQMRRVEIPCSR